VLREKQKKTSGYMKRKIVKQLLRLVATYFAIETAFGLLSLFQTPKEEVAMGVIATNPNIVFFYYYYYYFILRFNKPLNQGEWLLCWVLVNDL
jgi:hypothetical protein